MSSSEEKVREEKVRDDEEGVLVDEGESAFLNWLEDEDDVRTAEIEESYHSYARSKGSSSSSMSDRRPPPMYHQHYHHPYRGHSRGRGHPSSRRRGGGRGSSGHGSGSSSFRRKPRPMDAHTPHNDYVMGMGAAAAAKFISPGLPFDNEAMNRVISSNNQVQMAFLAQHMARLNAQASRPTIGSTTVGPTAVRGSTLDMTAPIPSIPISMAPPSTTSTPAPTTTTTGIPSTISTSTINPSAASFHPPYPSSMLSSMMQTSVANSLGSLDSGGGASTMFGAPIMAAAAAAAAHPSHPTHPTHAALPTHPGHPSHPSHHSTHPISVIQPRPMAAHLSSVVAGGGSGRGRVRAPPPGLPAHTAAPPTVRAVRVDPSRMADYRSQNDMLDQRRRHGRVDESFGRHHPSSRGRTPPTLVLESSAVGRSHSGSSSSSHGSTSPPPLSASDRTAMESRFRTFISRNQRHLQPLIDDLEEAKPMDGESIVSKASNLILARNSRETIQRALHREDTSELSDLFMYGLRQLQHYWTEREEFIRSRSSGTHQRESTPPERRSMDDRLSRDSVRRGRSDGAPAAPTAPKRARVAIVSYCAPDRDQGSMVGALALSFSLWESGSKLLKICLVPKNSKDTSILCSYFDLVVECEDFDLDVYPMHYFALFTQCPEVSRRAESVLFIPPQACFISDGDGKESEDSNLDEIVQSLMSKTDWITHCGLRFKSMIYLRSDVALYSRIMTDLMNHSSSTSRRLNDENGVIDLLTKMMNESTSLLSFGRLKEYLSVRFVSDDIISGSGASSGSGIGSSSDDSSAIESSSSVMKIPNVLLFDRNKVFELSKNVADCWIEYWFALITKLAIHNPNAYLITFALQPEFNQRLTVPVCAKLQTMIRDSKSMTLSEVYRSLVINSFVQSIDDHKEEEEQRESDKEPVQVSPVIIPDKKSESSSMFPTLHTSERMKSRLRVRPMTPDSSSD